MPEEAMIDSFGKTRDGHRISAVARRSAARGTLSSFSLSRGRPMHKLVVGLSPWVRQAVKRLFAVRWNCIVLAKPIPAR